VKIGFSSIISENLENTRKKRILVGYYRDMCKAIINITMFTHMVEESFKRLEAGFLLANLIKVSPNQAGKNTTKIRYHNIIFRRNQRTMEKGLIKNLPMDWDDALTESKLSQRPRPLFIGERRSKE
jgi:hypothetical protein